VLAVILKPVFGLKNLSDSGRLGDPARRKKLYFSRKAIL
jgi:hypothetical protein